jgi:hypothetical protein
MGVETEQSLCICSMARRFRGSFSHQGKLYAVKRVTDLIMVRDLVENMAFCSGKGLAQRWVEGSNEDCLPGLAPLWLV